jgi:hypothetical protein
MRRALLLLVVFTGTSCGDDEMPTSPTTTDSSSLSFFVTSVTSTTGNLGGLAGADATCQRLAAAVGQGARMWRAYLSVERDATNGNRPTHARDRIGSGPWFNANRVAVANSPAELHARTGDASVFLDERGQRINGQWTGSPAPVEHDILTGSNADGTLAAGLTCADWTSAAADVTAQVGHSDGMGPNQSTAGALSSWNSAHANQNCANTAPRGGAGRFYCFAR